MTGPRRSTVRLPLAKTDSHSQTIAPAASASGAVASNPADASSARRPQTDWLAPLVAACLLLPLVSGCWRQSPPTPSADPVATTDGDAAAPDAANTDLADLPEGWRRVAGERMPTAEVGQAVLPATVISDDGAEVTIEDTSRTIVGNDDIIAVMEALGLGDRVYAAPTSTATVAGRRAQHHFLFNRTTGIEGIISLDGTLFVGNSLRRHGKLAQPLRDAGTAMVIVDELQPAADKVRKIAAVFGYPAAGEKLADLVQSQLDQATQIAATITRKPRVIMVSATGGGGAPTVAGNDTTAARLIRSTGGINIGDEANVADYSQLSSEGIVAAAPEVILISEQDLQTFGGPAELWKNYPALRDTPAGLANRVWVMPDLQIKVTSIDYGSGAVALATALAELSSTLTP